MGFFFNRKKSTRAITTDIALLTVDISKLLKIVESCKRPVQFNVAENCLSNLTRKWGIETDLSLMAIKQLINNRRSELQVDDDEQSSSINSDAVVIAYDAVPYSDEFYGSVA